MYLVRGRPLLLCLLGPVMQSVGLIASGLLVLLGATQGGLVAVSIAAVYVAFAVRAYGSFVRGDSNGLTVRNLFRSYRIPWGDVRALYAHEGNLGWLGWSDSRRILVDVRGFGTIVCFVSAALAKRERLHAAQELVSIAAGYGHDVWGPTDEKVRRAAARESVAQYESERQKQRAAT